jgi:hypothetical protein
MSKHAWECFCDTAYYDKWAVRNTVDKSFKAAIHVETKEEAEFLVEKLRNFDALVEALEEIKSGMPKSDDDYYDGWAYEYRLIAEAALKAAKGE